MWLGLILIASGLLFLTALIGLAISRQSSAVSRGEEKSELYIMKSKETEAKP